MPLTARCGMDGTGQYTAVSASSGIFIPRGIGWIAITTGAMAIGVGVGLIGVKTAVSLLSSSKAYAGFSVMSLLWRASDCALDIFPATKSSRIITSTRRYQRREIRRISAILL